MGEKNNLLSIVASDDVVDCVKHLVKYLSCSVFGQVMYRHLTYISLDFYRFTIKIKLLIPYLIVINKTLYNI